jgi:hypothetical protein
MGGAWERPATAASADLKTILLGGCPEPSQVSGNQWFFCQQWYRRKIPDFRVVIPKALEIVSIP